MDTNRPEFCALTDLASTAIGGKVVFASDEWFAPAEMFLNPEAPVFKEELFTEFGKWMDGWETRRKRVPGHDWCLLKLGVPGTVYGFEVDTAFFTGNNVPAISILGAYLPDGPGLPNDVLDSATGAVINTGKMGTAATPTGVPSNTLLPNRAPNMGNGWETARNPQRPAILELGADGHVDFSYSKDWFVMRLGARCEIDDVEVDTNHFKGNFPESALIEICDLPDVWSLPVLEQKRKFEEQAYREKAPWKPLLRRTKMLPHAQQHFSRGSPKMPLENAGAATHVRVTIFPDGGVSRLRMHGIAAATPPAAKL